MGEASDIEELMPRALREVASVKRMRVLWSIATVVFSVLATTATVSWKVRGYIDDLSRENEKLRESILVMDKKLEALDAIQSTASEAKATADKALLYAQLLHKRGDNDKR